MTAAAGETQNEGRLFFHRARFSLLNKPPAGCSFTANLGGESAPHALGTAPAALIGSLRSQHGFAMRKQPSLKAIWRHHEQKQELSQKGSGCQRSLCRHPLGQGELFKDRISGYGCRPVHFRVYPKSIDAQEDHDQGRDRR